MHRRGVELDAAIDCHKTDIAAWLAVEGVLAQREHELSERDVERYEVLSGSSATFDADRAVYEATGYNADPGAGYEAGW